MIDEHQLREMLERRAETISATPTDAANALRRARRRLARNATVAGLASLVVVAGALVGLRTLRAMPTPVEPATSPPSPAALGALAYVVDGDVYVAEWDGSNAVRVADGRPSSECVGNWAGEYWAEGSIWSPDGRYLAYRHRDCDRPEPPGIETAKRTDRWDVVISDPNGNVVASFPSGTGWRIPWSPDSTRVAVWVRYGETIGVFGVDGVRRALLTMPSGWQPSCDCDPVWSPDGESLRLQDVVLPIDGSTPYSIDPSTPDDADVVTSPDGSRIAYVTRTSLVVAESDGSNPRVVFRGEGSDELAVIDFSPEGDRILFSTAEGVMSSLRSVNTDGSDLRRLVAGTPWGDWLSPRPAP